MKLGCFYALAVAWLGRLLLTVAWVLLIFCVILGNLLLYIWYLGKAALSVWLSCMSAYFSCSGLFIEFFLFKYVLSSAWHFIFGVYFYEVFVETETRERIEKVITELIIDIFFNFLLKDLILCFFLKSHDIFDIPLWGKYTFLIDSGGIDGLNDFFMLKIKGLYWPGDVIVRADSFLHILTIIDVRLLDIVILLLITGGW